MTMIMTGVANTGRIASLNRSARCSGWTRRLKEPLAPRGICRMACPQKTPTTTSRSATASYQRVAQTSKHGSSALHRHVERYLKPGAAGGRGKERAAGQEVLADRVRGQVKAKLGDFTGNIRGERVTVRARPSTIFVRIRIAGDRGTDIVDHCVDTRSAPIEQDLRSGSEPVIVRAHTVDAKRLGAIGDAEAEHLVSGIALGPARLDREPSVH